MRVIFIVGSAAFVEDICGKTTPEAAKAECRKDLRFMAGIVTELGVGCQVSGIGCRVSGVGCQVSGVG